MPDSEPAAPTADRAAARAAVLMLADSRLPAGGHAHSGGVEAALAAGLVRDLAGLAVFLAGRLRTAGHTAAAIAAAAAHLASTTDAAGLPSDRLWSDLDAETDARTPSPAQRLASRQQGRGLLRAGRAAWPAPWLATLSSTAGGPHHPVVLGAVAAAAGCSAHDAAVVAGYLAVSGPAQAALRLHGLDPIAVHALVAGLAGEIAAVAATAAVAGAAAAGATGNLADLPAPAAPRLDLLAEAHARAAVRLFAS